MVPMQGVVITIATSNRAKCACAAPANGKGKQAKSGIG